MLPTTTPETLLIVYRGRAHVDEWLDVLSEAVLLRRMRTGGDAALRARPQTDPSVDSATPNQEGHSSMTNPNDSSAAAPTAPPSAEDDLQAKWQRVVGRRSFLKGVGLAGAAAVPGSACSRAGTAREDTITKGDVAILRFLAAVELIEHDLWQQYNELGGVNGGNAAYMAALSNLDGDMPQYIADNTDDELSHAAFLNAYLRSKGARPVNLDEFRTLPSSKATGARQIGRLTNLQSLNVDTSWYVRYRSTKNPDLGATFPQAVNITHQPAIPLNDTDTPPDLPAPVPPANAQETRMQAIANAAGFHFAYIEQGGSSLYSVMALKATSLEVLRIIVVDRRRGNQPFLALARQGGKRRRAAAGRRHRPGDRGHLPRSQRQGRRAQPDQPDPARTLPSSCQGLPACSIVRPTLDRFGGAVATIASFTADRLFEGQSAKFFRVVNKLAQEADAATRHAR